MSTTISYYAGGKLHHLQAEPADKMLNAPGRRAAGAATSARARSAMRALSSQRSRVERLTHEIHETETMLSVATAAGPTVIPTPTMVLEGATKAAVKRLQDEFGLEIVAEGRQGKLLLRAPEAGAEGIQNSAQAARKAFKSGAARVAHPNFLRVIRKTLRKPSAAGMDPLWNHHNEGSPGVPGADVAAHAVWTLTRGDAKIRVAVLDEGVDTSHPALKQAVVAERDFVDENATAMPDGDDAHGTACAGIIVSRDQKIPGLASSCSLVAVRIAKGDGNDGWVFDDFQTADAIDWAWEEAQADVLSNSWGGGPPVDVITRAIERALKKGRQGRGAVVAFATGNEDGPVDYPATVPGVLAVGASNPWDERKSPTSRDRETWWGSNFGKQISLVAPGVRIATTDIHGAAGYTSKSFVEDFNGTSSATPHVAAGAALVLSVEPKLKGDRVREVLLASVDRLTPDGKWNKFVGWGRLNLFSAARLARR